MRHRVRFSRGIVATLAMILPLLLGPGASALPRYEIIALGLQDAGHTSEVRFSTAEHLTESGYVAGLSTRAGAIPNAGSSAWLYDGADTVRLGFADAEHTKDDGYQSSTVVRLNESGTVLGWSWRYTGRSSTGQSVWRSDGGGLERLGYFDADHTDGTNGWQLTRASDLTESGYVVGTSDRYNGEAFSGSSAWLHDGVGTVRLGFIDEDHTRESDGGQFSILGSLTESGYVTGISARYTEKSNRGWTAWRFDGTRTVRIGLFDDEHTVDVNGLQVSDVIDLNESGWVLGKSDRYVGESSAGRSAWLYDGADTIRLGFTGAEYTGKDGGQYTWATLLTESGFAAGASSRFPGAESGGVSAWLYDGEVKRLGFTDAEHTFDDGQQWSSVDHLTESGSAAGTSRRAGGVLGLGQSAWWYDGVSTRRLGLIGDEHTRLDGHQFSEAQLVTESGYVVGRSNRYHVSRGNGVSVWLFDGSSTIRLGLMDEDHSRVPYDSQGSTAEFLTESGYVAGISERYSRGSGKGRTAWVFDANTETVIPIVLDVRADGYAVSNIAFLGEDGLALGSYQRFETDDDLGTRHAFVWTPEDGAMDLGALIDGGIEPGGWSSLGTVLQANGLPEILGWGVQDGDRIAYLLAPVPEPGAVALTVLGLLVLVPFARVRLAARGDR